MKKEKFKWLSSKLVLVLFIIIYVLLVISLSLIEEINNKWQHIKNENIQDIKIKVLAIDDYTVIAEWLLKQNNQEFDGIYEIKFNKNLECIYFRVGKW